MNLVEMLRRSAWVGVGANSLLLDTGALGDRAPKCFRFRVERTLRGAAAPEIFVGAPRPSTHGSGPILYHQERYLLFLGRAELSAALVEALRLPADRTFELVGRDGALLLSGERTDFPNERFFAATGVHPELESRRVLDAVALASRALDADPATRAELAGEAARDDDAFARWLADQIRQTAGPVG